MDVAGELWLVVRAEDERAAQHATTQLSLPDEVLLRVRTWDALTISSLDVEPLAVIVPEHPDLDLAQCLSNLQTPQARPQLLVAAAQERWATIEAVVAWAHAESLSVLPDAWHDLRLWLPLAVERVLRLCTARELDRMLWHNEAKFAEVLIRSQQPLVVVGEDGQIVFGNAGAAHVFEGASSQLFGQSAAEFFVEGPRGRLRLRSPYDHGFDCETMSITWEHRPARLVLLQSTSHGRGQVDLREQAPDFLTTVAAVASELNARTSRVEAVIEALGDARSKMKLLVRRLGDVASAHHRVFGGLQEPEPLQELLEELLHTCQDHLQVARRDLHRLQRSAAYLQRSAHPSRRAMELVSVDAIVRVACREFGCTHPEIGLSVQCAANELLVSESDQVHGLIGRLLAGVVDAAAAGGVDIEGVDVLTRSVHSRLGFRLEVRLGEGGTCSDEVLGLLREPAGAGGANDALTDALQCLNDVGAVLRFGARGGDRVWVDVVVDPQPPLRPRWDTIEHAR